MGQWTAYLQEKKSLLPSGERENKSNQNHNNDHQILNTCFMPGTIPSTPVTTTFPEIRAKELLVSYFQLRHRVEAFGKYPTGRSDRSRRQGWIRSPNLFYVKQFDCVHCTFIILLDKNWFTTQRKHENDVYGKAGQRSKASGPDW